MCDSKYNMRIVSLADNMRKGKDIREREGELVMVVVVLGVGRQ